MSKIAEFQKSLKIQIAGFGKVFKFQLNITPKIFSKKNPNLFVNSWARRHCKAHIILLPKTNIKRIKLIKAVFLKIKKMKIAGFWKSSPHIHVYLNKVAEQQVG